MCFLVLLYMYFKSFFNFSLTNVPVFLHKQCIIIFFIYLFFSSDLQIFTEDLPEVENLPREEVLNYLENINSELAIPYLVSHIYMYV